MAKINKSVPAHHERRSNKHYVPDVSVAAGLTAVNKTKSKDLSPMSLCPLCCSSHAHVVLLLLGVVLQIYVTQHFHHTEN